MAIHQEQEQPLIHNAYEEATVTISLSSTCWGSLSPLSFSFKFIKNGNQVTMSFPNIVGVGTSGSAGFITGIFLLDSNQHNLVFIGFLLYGLVQQFMELQRLICLVILHSLVEDMSEILIAMGFFNHKSIQISLMNDLILL